MRGKFLWIAALLILAACAHRWPMRQEDLGTPRVDHILLEVKDLNVSLGFYRDALGLRLRQKSRDFATLDARNIGVYLWRKHWDWEAPRGHQERLGLGMK